MKRNIIFCWLLFFATLIYAQKADTLQLDIQSNTPSFISNGKKVESIIIIDSIHCVLCPDDSIIVNNIITNLGQSKQAAANSERLQDNEKNFSITSNGSIVLKSKVNNNLDSHNKISSNDVETSFSTFSFHIGKLYKITHGQDPWKRECTFRLVRWKHKDDVEMSIPNDSTLKFQKESKNLDSSKDTKTIITLGDSTDFFSRKTIADSLIIKKLSGEIISSDIKYDFSKDSSICYSYREIPDSIIFKSGSCVTVCDKNGNEICILKFVVEPSEDTSSLWMVVIFASLIVLLVAFRKWLLPLIIQSGTNKEKQNNSQISKADSETFKQQLRVKLDSLKGKVSSEIWDIVSIDDIDNIGDIRDAMIMVKAKNPSLNNDCDDVLSFISAHEYVWKNDGVSEPQEKEDTNAIYILNNKAQKSKQELVNSLEELFNILPENIKDTINHDSLLDTNNIQGIIDELCKIEGHNRRALRKKCSKIRVFISEKKEILEIQADLTPALPKNEPVDPIQQTQQEPSLYDEISDAISSLYIPKDDETTQVVTDSISRETYDKLKKIIETLSENVKKQQEEKVAAEKKKIEDTKQDEIDKAIKKTKDELSEEIKNLQTEKSNAEQRAREAESSKQNAIDEAKRAVVEEKKKEIDELKRKKQEAEEQAKKAEESKQKAVDDAKQAVVAEKRKEIDELKRKKQEAEEQAKRAEESKQKAVDDAKNAANKDKEKELRNLEDKKNSEIKSLEKAMEDFTRSLSSVVSYTETYSKQVHALIELGNQVQSAAYSLLDVGVDDPYFIMKALSKYGKAINGINMEKFLTDVNMASKANFMFNDSSLAKFKPDNKEIDSIVRSYFFQYLGNYINAIMVLNESMAGLGLLTPELKSKVAIFEKYRNDILSLAKQLQINVIYVKVGDMAGENVDLKANPVDVGIGKPGQILEIENCIVYQANDRKPQTKIKVTIKK